MVGGEVSAWTGGPPAERPDFGLVAGEGGRRSHRRNGGVARVRRGPSRRVVAASATIGASPRRWRRSAESTAASGARTAAALPLSFEESPHPLSVRDEQASVQRRDQRDERDRPRHCRPRGRTPFFSTAASCRSKTIVVNHRWLPCSLDRASRGLKFGAGGGVIHGITVRRWLCRRSRRPDSRRLTAQLGRGAAGASGGWGPRSERAERHQNRARSKRGPRGSRSKLDVGDMLRCRGPTRVPTRLPCRDSRGCPQA